MGTVEGWLQLVNTGGIVATLLLAVWLGARGMVWPRTTVEKFIEEQRKTMEATATLIGKEISAGMKSAVEDGIKLGISQAITLVRDRGEDPGGRVG